MNYFALFFDDNSYFDKSLALIKFLCNPNSKSLPHITLRLFKKENKKLEYIRNKKITYLDIIEPGAFNLEKKNSNYVVYLLCESEELEDIDYKPDYPFSRLHITMYEGQDNNFAIHLLELLNNYDWHFRIQFEFPKCLIEREIGSVSNSQLDYEKIYCEIVGCSNYSIFTQKINSNKKIIEIKNILDNLSNYVNSTNQKIEKLTNNLSDDYLTLKHFHDESDDSAVMEHNVQQRMKMDRDINNPFIKPFQGILYVTPPEYAFDMAQCALDAFGSDDIGIDFGDSAVGTGSLFIAIKNLTEKINKKNNMNYHIDSAIGIEIEEEIAKEALRRCGHSKLSIIHGDAISSNINLRKKRNLMIVNPPFNRHEEIPKLYKKECMEIAEKQTGITINADAGLYVYHLLIMDKWLSDDGIAVWLLPTIFLQTRYGGAVREYLTKNVHLIRMHIYDEEKLQFSSAKISTTIIVFKKTTKKSSQNVKITFGDSLYNPEFMREISIDAFTKKTNNWRDLIFSMDKKKNFQKITNEEICFSMLFKIKRGLATGANSFFVMTREKAIRIGIPDFAMKPILPKARFLNSKIIESNKEGNPIVNPELILIDSDLEESEIKNNYPDFYKYLQLGKQKDKNGKAIIDRYLVQSRKPWYKQEKRDPPLYLLTYMGRNKSDGPPLYFLYNKSRAIGLNTYILLYPRKWLAELLKNDISLCEKLHESLNSTARLIIAEQTRIYSGGLKKIEPGELKGLPIINLPKELICALKRADIVSTK